MNRSTLRRVSLILALGIAAVPLHAQNAAAEFYRSLIEAVDSVQGDLEIEFLPGKTKTVLSGWGEVEWDIPDNSPARPARALIHFLYRNGRMQSATVDYEPWISVESIRAKRMIFGSNGRLREIQLDNGGDVLGSRPLERQAVLQRHLELGSTPSRLFLGAPYGGIPETEPKKGFVSRVIVRTLSIGFREGAILNLHPAEAGTPASSIQLDANGHVNFRDVILDVVSEKLTGRLKSLDVNAKQGRYWTDKADLRFQPGTRMQFGTVDFRWPEENGASIDATHGFLRGEVGVGTSLTLSGAGKTQSLFIADAGSSVNLTDVRFAVGASGSTLEISTASDWQLRLAEARMPIGRNSFVWGRSGALIATLGGKWKPGAEPQAQGTLHLVTIDVYNGAFGLENGSAAALRSGMVRSSNLRFDTTKTSWLAGDLEHVSLDFEHGTRFSVPDQYTITCGEGARISSIAGEPVSIDEAGRVTGSLYAVLPFHLIETKKDDKPVYGRDGIVKSKLTLKANGKVESTELLAHADITAEKAFSVELEDNPDTPVDKTLRARLYLENASWTYAPDGKIQFSAAVEAFISPFGAFDFMAPDTLQDDFDYILGKHLRMTLFPVRLRVSFDAPIHLVRTNIKRVGDIWSGDDLDPEKSWVSIIVKPRDAARGQDGSGQNQQLVKAGCIGPLGNSNDVMLKPALYTPPLLVKLVYPNEVLKVQFKADLKTIQFDPDACDGDLALANIVASILLGQPLGAFTIDTAIKWKLGDLIREKIEGKIERCLGFDGKFTVGKCSD